METSLRVMRRAPGVSLAGLLPALLTAWLGAATSPASAQEEPGFPLDILLDDARRALVVEAVIHPDDTATVTDRYVTDVPPAGHLAEPAQLLVESFDRSGQKLYERNAWNPRFEFRQGEDGLHEKAIVEGEIGEFDVPFDSDLGSVAIRNLQNDQPIATVDVRFVVADFCAANASDAGCDGYEPGDADGDGVVDGIDNCPEVPNPGQEDVLDRDVGDACARPGDFDGNGHVDWKDFLVIVNQGLNRPATGPGYDATPMDMNGDGLIDVLDVRRVILLCDRPSCQTAESAGIGGIPE